MRWLRVIFGFSIISLIFVFESNSYANIYTVKSGDSLIGISKKLGFKPYQIKRLNPHTKWLKIRPGEKIKIPSTKKAHQKPLKEISYKNIYTVKPGDSLIKIAKKLKIKPALIKKYNPKIHWLKIRPGNKIKIPPMNNAVVKVKREEKQHSKDIYVVRKNDSLIKIAKKLNVSIEEIKKLNPDIDWSKIRPNNEIKLPQTSQKTVLNKQIEAAVKQNVATTQEKAKKKSILQQNNPLSCKKLEAALIKKNRSLKPGTIGDGYYIVKRGDTLSSIAGRFGLTLKRLMELNPNKSRFIKPGDLIVIPGELTQKIMLSKKENLYIPPRFLVYSTPYKIRRGDTLYKVAKRFNTKVYVIKMLNNLGGNTLIAGRYIFVPNKNMVNKSRLELEYSLLRERRKALIHYAERFLGRPYRFGGDSLLHGIDCSAFVQKIYERFIRKRLPRTAEEQYKTVGVFVPLSRIQVGDLLFFHTLNYARVTHVGIYIGNNRFIHAAGRRSGIKISRLTRYYLKRLVAVKRVFRINNKYAYLRHRPG